MDKSIIDEEIYKSYFRSGLVRDWTSCKPAIVAQRRSFNNPQLYVEFEALALRWATARERETIRDIPD